MLDTNVILSLAIFRSRTIQAVFDDIALHHELLLCTYVIDEAREVIARKWPARAGAFETFLQRASYEAIVTPLEFAAGLFDIRDPADYPVLYSAILAEADVLVTGDKDFGDVAVETPEILTSAAYAERYVR